MDLSELKTCPESINVAQLTGAYEGDFFIVRNLNDPVFREHKTYCHIATAWRILRAGRPAGWKTFKMLTTLRQAIRECFAQGMPLNIPDDGIGQRELRDWLVIARHHDAIHHGQATF